MAGLKIICEAWPPKYPRQIERKFDDLADHEQSLVNKCSNTIRTVSDTEPPLDVLFPDIAKARIDLIPYLAIESDVSKRLSVIAPDITQSPKYDIQRMLGIYENTYLPGNFKIRSSGLMLIAMVLKNAALKIMGSKTAYPLASSLNDYFDKCAKIDPISLHQEFGTITKILHYSGLSVKDIHCLQGRLRTTGSLYNELMNGKASVPSDPHGKTIVWINPDLDYMLPSGFLEHPGDFLAHGRLVHGIQRINIYDHDKVKRFRVYSPADGRTDLYMKRVDPLRVGRPFQEIEIADSIAGKLAKRGIVDVSAQCFIGSAYLNGNFYLFSKSIKTIGSMRNWGFDGSRFYEEDIEEGLLMNRYAMKDGQFQLIKKHVTDNSSGILRVSQFLRKLAASFKVAFREKNVLLNISDNGSMHYTLIDFEVR